MGEHRFSLTFLLLLTAQILLMNYLHLSQFVMISILPTMILLLPIKCTTIRALVIAFCSGLAVDLLADGVVGLNILALVPVAFVRFGVIRLIFGGEVFARKEDISFVRQGWMKMCIAILMAEAVFFVLYIWADGAGTRPLWFNAARFAASLAASFIVSIPVAELLKPDRPQKKW